MLDSRLRGNERNRLSYETMMPPKSLIAILMFAALPVLGAAPRAAAQAAPTARFDTTSPPPRHVRGRITIHPGRLLYRRCVDWYELQGRPSGTVLFPEMRCRWLRG